MSPLRQLARSYSEKKISTKDYLEKRTELLNKIEINEEINTLHTDELIPETAPQHPSEEQPSPLSPVNKISDLYSKTDIALYSLGIIAALSLAYILYS